MTAATQAGALSHFDVSWDAIHWHAAHRIVRRLQARIVKATQASGETASRNRGVKRGLSRMRGNPHVRFLGSWAGAILPATRLAGSTQNGQTPETPLH